MAEHSVDLKERLSAAPCDVIETCPICGGGMEAVYERAHQKVCICRDCNTSISVPFTAWNMRRKR